MPQGYSRAQILIHWVTVVLVALQYILHEGISDAFDIVEDGGTVEPTALVASHVFLGAAIFILVLFRLQLRLTRGAPPPPEKEPAALKLAAHATHWAFYALLLLMPITGAVAWFRASEGAAEVHEVLRAVLLVLILVHIAAALVHQFVWKTGLMDRMRRPQM